MVSPTERLQAQQRAERQRRLQTDRRLQQEALRSGKSVSQLRQEKRIEEARREAEERKRKLEKAQERAKDIIKDINEAKSSSELEKILEEIKSASKTEKRFLPKESQVKKRLQNVKRVEKARREQKKVQQLTSDIGRIFAGQISGGSFGEKRKELERIIGKREAERVINRIEEDIESREKQAIALQREEQRQELGKLITQQSMQSLEPELLESKIESALKTGSITPAPQGIFSLSGEKIGSSTEFIISSTPSIDIPDATTLSPQSIEGLGAVLVTPSGEQVASLDTSTLDRDFQSIERTDFPEIKSEIQKSQEKELRDLGFESDEAEIIARQQQIQGRSFTKSEAEDILKRIKEKPQDIVSRARQAVPSAFQSPDQLTEEQKNRVEESEERLGKLFQSTKDFFQPAITGRTTGVSARTETTPEGQRVIVSDEAERKEELKSGISGIAGTTAGIVGGFLSNVRDSDLIKKSGRFIGEIETGKTIAEIETTPEGKALKAKQETVSDVFGRFISTTPSPFAEGRSLEQQFEITGEQAKKSVTVGAPNVIKTTGKPFEVFFTGFQESIKDVERTSFGKEFGFTGEEFKERGRIPETAFIGGFSISPESRIEQIEQRAEEQGVSTQQVISQNIPFGGIYGGNVQTRVNVGQREKSREIEQEIKPFIREKTREYQEKVNRGQLSVEESNKRLEKDINQKLESLSKKKTQELREEIKQTQEFKIADVSVRKSTLANLGFTIATSFAGGFALGKVATVAPRFATGVEALSFAPVAIEIPKLGKGLAQGDIGLQEVGEAGLIFGGALTGGVIGARIGTRRVPSSEIEKAISRAEIRDKSLGIGVDSILKQVEIPENELRRLRNLQDEGFEVRVIETELKPTVTGDKDLIPNVKAVVSEVVGRRGNIVERKSLGRFVSEQKGKVFSESIVERALGKIENEKGLFFVEKLKGQLKGKKFVPKEEATFLEDVTKTGQKRLGESPGSPELIELSTEISPLTSQQLPRRSLLKRPIDITRDFDLDIFKSEGVRKDFFEDLRRERKLTTPTDRVESLVLSRDIGLDIRTIQPNLFLQTKPRITKGLSSTEKIGLREQLIRESRRKPSKKPKTTEEGLEQLTLDLSELQKQTPQKQVSDDVIKLIGSGREKAISQTKEIARDVARRTDQRRVARQASRGGALGVQIGTPRIISDISATRLSTVLPARQDTGQRLSLLTGAQQLGGQQSRQFESAIQRDLTSASQIQPQLSSQQQSAALRTQTSLSGISGSGISGVSVTPEVKKPKKPILFDFDKDKRRAFVTKNPDEPTNVFIIEKGKRKKITKNPIRKEQALDLGAYVTDNSLSADFRIKKAKGKVSEPNINVPKNYFNVYGFKFRTFKQRKGKRTPLKQGRYIERSKQRLDTAGEISQITTDRFLAQQRRQATRTKRYSANLNKAFGFNSLFRNQNNSVSKNKKSNGRSSNKKSKNLNTQRTNFNLGRTIKNLV